MSAEVQEGIYQNVRAMTTESGSALHRMLAYEKEHATMRTKCIDEAVWERYKANLASLMQVSHDRVCPHVTRHSFLMF